MNLQQHKNERLLSVLIAPQISEKATMIAEKNNQIIFYVSKTATKSEVKQAIELLFKVDVTSVQVSNLKGKSKRFGRSIGRKSDVKKAFVSVKSGQEINFAEGVV